eukprot:CAMPEP_0172828494 /NCGR_PEP_ID=MMETSP1075-20121228/20883_1 /TAXON_ID=2916 /ORGANISM="Ceratium fusus, Strain PA161109" /LENGTH=409 /DNA_ID=CAMNT_0013670495 /DNA_START=107 /DNA_END=1337 /DNA_ORIENTATION=+
MTAPATAASHEDVKRLQTQLDQMKERLDFISPILPLVNFVQDFFQKVECEANLQLMRMQKAQVMPGANEGDKEGMSNAQLETVKFIHFVTDMLLAMHGGGLNTELATLHSSRGDQSSPNQEPRHVPQLDENGSGNIPGGGSARPSKRPPANAHRQPTPPLRTEDEAGGASGASGGSARSSRRPSSNAVQQTAGQWAPTPPLRLEPPERTTGGYLLRSPSSPFTYHQQQQQQQQASERLVEQLRLGSAVPKSSPSDVSREQSASALSMEAGTGGTEEDHHVEQHVEHSLGPNIVLGKGSWAASYRQARGIRRDSLKLLCTCGIVTSRELSDDLTVISEEHIEECVLIAEEMLKTWPLDVWAKQPGEAKKFFEAKLTSLYQRKFGEQDNDIDGGWQHVTRSELVCMTHLPA